MKSIKKGSLSRGLSIAKLGLKTGMKAAGNYVSKNEDQSAYIISQMKTIAEELGELKGTMMKIGQSLSMYGEHFLPPEANAFLKNLQFESPPMNWESIETTIEKELGFGVFNELDIEEKALAAASLGQVHKAVHKKTGEVYAMKIQYPGVDEAISSDIKNLQRVMSLAKIFPNEMKLDQIFLEIKEMLYQETNYHIEKDWTKKVYKHLKGNSSYVVPKVIDAYCSPKILTTTFIEGHTIDSKKVQSLSQENKNELGYSFLNYYLHELFKYKAVQTDPHLGNYRVKINKNEKPQLVLFDFGAMREVPNKFSKSFKGLIKSSVDHDEKNIIKFGTQLTYLKKGDSKDLIQHYIDLCKLVTEPFNSSLAPKNCLNSKGEYLWKKTDLPKRVASKGTDLVKGFKIRTPPREAVFLDRKLGGTFIFLSVLGFQANSKEWIIKKLDEI